MTNRRFVALLAVSLLVALACGQDKSNGSKASGDDQPVSSDAVLVAADAPGPDGIDWASADPSGVEVELPSGGDWMDDSGGPGVSSESLGIVVWVKRQADVDAAMLDDYAASFIENNQRDAPKYALVDKQKGKVAGNTAMRIDGTFDNGTPLVTRDYVVMIGGDAIIVMARGPVAAKATVQAIADRVVATAQRMEP